DSLLIGGLQAAGMGDVPEPAGHVDHEGEARLPCAGRSGRRAAGRGGEDDQGQEQGQARSHGLSSDWGVRLDSPTYVGARAAASTRSTRPPLAQNAAMSLPSRAAGKAQSIMF